MHRQLPVNRTRNRYAARITMRSPYPPPPLPPPPFPPGALQKRDERGIKKPSAAREVMRSVNAARRRAQRASAKIRDSARGEDIIKKKKKKARARVRASPRFPRFNRVRRSAKTVALGSGAESLFSTRRVYFLVILDFSRVAGANFFFFGAYE